MNQIVFSPAAHHWQKIGIKPHHGVNIPLFSLHSEQSCGIGEYLDLLDLIPWCKSLGLDIIQLLPLNDTGPDSSPYSAISAFALNPLHLALSQLPFLEKFPALKNEIVKLQQLNRTQRIDYRQVMEGKESFLKAYYNSVFSFFVESADFKKFITKNSWLKGYALFKTLKIQRQWKPWSEWESELQSPNKETLASLFVQFEKEISYHMFVQYLCFSQLELIKSLASQQSLFLKGDIPILISRESADVWLERNLFQLEYSAGAPPDMYASEGQKWGFPIYDWKIHEENHYEWWKLRLKVASQLYHLYRLDHVVGFFRIWAIPLALSGKEGQFIPQDSHAWTIQGEKILRMLLDSCEMLPIGEDLGDIPPQVRNSLQQLGICGTKVMRWERDWNGDKHFTPVQNYLQESMTTVSTHDSEPLHLWWKNHQDEAADYAREKNWTLSSLLTNSQAFELLRESHHSASFFHINLLNEYFALIPNLTWLDLEDERINIPGIVSDKNWSYRFRPSIKEIINNNELKKLIQDLLANNN